MALTLLTAILAIGPTLCLYANRGIAPLFVVLAVVALVDLLRARRPVVWPLAAGGVSVCLLGFLAWGGASITWEVFPGLAVRRLGELLGVALGGGLLIAVAREADERTRTRLLLAAGGGLIAASAIATLDRALGFALCDALFRLAGSPQAPGFLIPGRFKPAASFAVPLGILVAGIAATEGRWRFAGLVILSAAGLVAASHSVAGAVALAVAGGVALAGLLARRLATALVAGLIVAAFAGAPALKYLPDSSTLVHAHPWIPHSSAHRAIIWGFVGEKIAERPILGWGLDSSREVGGEETREQVFVDGTRFWSSQQSVLPLHPHNFVLQIWLETGAVGAALVAGLLLSLLRLAARRGGPHRLAFEATFAAAICVALVSFGIWQAWWLSSLWLFAVFAVAQTRPTADV